MIKRLFLREAGIVAKDRNLWLILFLAPFFFALFYGTIYVNKTESDVAVAVVDDDHSEVSRQLTRYLDSHQKIRIVENSPDLNFARKLMFDQSVQAVVYIPGNFEADFLAVKGVDLKVYLNASRFLVANDISLAVNEITGIMGAGVRLKYYQSNQYSHDQAVELVEPLQSDIRFLFNTTSSYGDFIIPGLLVIILQQTLLIGLSESMARERELNTLREISAISGGKIIPGIIGKSLFYIFLYGAFSLFFFSILYWMFRLNFLGSALALVICNVLFLIAVSLLSMFVGSLCKSELAAFQATIFVSYPSFLLSGYSWPMTAIPLPLKGLAQIFPSTPFIDCVARITQMGAGVEHVIPHIVHLLILSAAGLILNYFRWKTLFGKTTEY